MRKHLLSILFVPIFSFAQTSTYFPFPSDSATWSVNHWDFATVGYTCWNTYHYGINGDTVIGANTYHKLYQNNSGNSVVTDSFFNPLSAFYATSFREDSAKRVWAIHPQDSVEMLLYDFSLNIGDTFYFEYFQPQTWGVVISIDSEQIGSSFRRRIELMDMNFTPHIWIEGVGSLDGIIQFQMISSFSDYLLCHSHNSQMLYEPTTYCHCDYTLGIEEESGVLTFDLFPNPSQNGFTVLTTNSELFQVEICDAAGHVVETSQVQGGGVFETNGLAPGMYMVRITDGQSNSQMLRWVKSHK